MQGLDRQSQNQHHDFDESRTEQASEGGEQRSGAYFRSQIHNLDDTSSVQSHLITSGIKKLKVGDNISFAIRHKTKDVRRTGNNPSLTNGIVFTTNKNSEAVAGQSMAGDY